MPGLSRVAQRFLEDYRGRMSDAQSAARLPRDIVERIARESGAHVHVVAGRAKTVESLRGKFRRKHYRRPDRQITDLVGVRVITYYRDAVDTVVAGLLQNLDINSKESIDKRIDLGLRDFGYRSVHLIARLRAGPALDQEYQFLQRNWFEIQVRSILEHAWAEIEHEVVYKSGITQPDAVLRRFAALAGTLEVLDGEFLSLRQERSALVETYRDRYRQRADWHKSFDVARLLGFLECSRPGRGWRQAAEEGQPFAVGLEVSCVEALKAVGLGTPASLSQMFRSSRFRYILKSFAALQGISSEEVSHLANVVLAVVVKDARVVRHHFPEMMYDPVVTQIVERRAAR